MTRPTLIRTLACAALLLACAAPRLAAQDVKQAGRAYGIEPAPALLDLLAQDSTAFEFRRAWRQKTQRVRQQRQALERRAGLRLSVAQLAEANAAVTGTFRVPVLMGLYAGTAAPHPQADYQTRLFGSQQYSARTFYQEISRGAFTLDGTVSPWIPLPQNAAYYQPVPGINTQFGRTKEFLQHTLAGADAGMDFGQFDNDGPDGVPNSGDDDGYVDAAAFVYPTTALSCGGPGIWPHRWVYRAWWGAPFTTNDARAGGGFILVDDYLIQGGLECGGTGLMQIGTFSHEMGHALGLPDLYDTYEGDGTTSGLGEWDLMASGNWRMQDAPAHMGAWSKDFLGWVNVETVAATRTGYTLPRVYDAGTVLRYDLPGTREYFLLENRGAVGSDRNIHAPGLLVYHVDPVVVDSTLNANRVNAHARMGVALEQADGWDHLGLGTGRGDAADPFPGSAGRTTFGDAGTPSTRSNGGAPSGLELRSITLNPSTGRVSFDMSVSAVISAPLAVQIRSRGEAVSTANLAVAVGGGGAVEYRARTARASAWLTVSPDTGTFPGTLTLTARAQGLSAGVYQDTVVITSSSAANSPLRVAVDYLVQAGTLLPGDSLGGRITTVGRPDTLTVQLNAGDVVDFGIFHALDPLFTPGLTLVAPNGQSQSLSFYLTGGRGGVRQGKITPKLTIPMTGTWRAVVRSAFGTGDYVVKVRRAGAVPGLDPLPRLYVPVAVDGSTGRDTAWVVNVGTGVLGATAVSVLDAPWLQAAAGPAGAGGPRPGGAAGEALLAPGSPVREDETAPGQGVAPPQPAPAGAVPVVLTATRGGRTQGEHTGYLMVYVGDGWAGPAVLEVRMRVHEREVDFVTLDKLPSRPLALAVAPEGDLAVVLANGQVVRMDPQTGATRPWAATTGLVWWGMAFGPDSAAYIAEWTRVARVARDGTVTTAMSIPGIVFDVVVTPAGAVFAASEDGLWRLAPGGAATRLFTGRTYGVAYSPADGMIYAAYYPVGGTPSIRRVDPATGTVAGTLPSGDGTAQQQLEIGAGGVMYGRNNYLDLADLRRLTPAGQVDRTWWMPHPFPQAIALAPDGTLYGTAGDRVFRFKVEGVVPNTHLAGDVTGDGAVTAQDALGVLSVAVGKALPGGWTAAWGDANCDGLVSAQDALIILSHAVGKDVAQFCVGKPQP